MERYNSLGMMDTPIEELTELADAMREGLQPCIKDRTHRLRTYRRCFPGSAGVRWLVAQGHAGDEDAAAALGNAMLQAGLLHHVAYEHTFKNADLLYKFSADDDSGALRELSVSAAAASAARTGSGSGLGSGGTTPRVPGTPPGGLASVSSVPLISAASTPSHGRSRSMSAFAGAHHHAHRALLNAQVHSLNHKLERLASQHASLVAANAQQQEAWEGQATADLRDLKEAVGQLALALAASQQQQQQLMAQASHMQGVLSSQRAVAAVQQLIMALAALALGTAWAPPALWALAAAAAGALAVALIAWSADDARERRAAEREALAAAQLRARGAAGGAAAGGAGGAARLALGAPAGVPAGLAPLAVGKGGGGAGACVVAATATASEDSVESAAALPPMAPEVEELLVGRVYGGKAIGDTSPPLEAFESWPDGDVIMQPTPKSSDMAVTRVDRYVSPVHVGVPTPAHAAWEARQARWRAAAAEADADDDAAAARDQGGDANPDAAGSWVPTPGKGIPINQYQIHFESDLFVGKMLVYIKGLPSSHEPYFAGKKRRSVLMFQGRFKRPLQLSDVITGQEFDRPYKNLRGCWLMEKVVLAFAKRVVSVMELGDVTKQPYMVFPLMALAHVVNVAPPGQEPPIDQAEEDLRLWDPSLVDKKGGPMAADARRKFFMNEKNLAGRAFDTDHVWTFYIWQQVIDVAGYFLDLMVQQYDVIQHLDGQPLQSMVKHKPSGKYLFHMVYWNKKQIQETERLSALYAEQDAAALAAAQRKRA